MLSPDTDFEHWKERLHALRDPRSHQDAIEFCALVDEAFGKDDVRVTRALMSTFSGIEDHEVKESVVRVLASHPFESYYDAYLEELPRLMQEARNMEWPQLLAVYPERALEPHEAARVAELAKQKPEESQRILLSILQDEDLMIDHPWTNSIVDSLKRSLADKD